MDVKAVCCLWRGQAERRGATAGAMQAWKVGRQWRVGAKVVFKYVCSRTRRCGRKNTRIGGVTSD